MSAKLSYFVMRFNLILLLIILLGSVSGSRKSLKLGSFSWSDCGPESDVIQVQSIQLSPDPIVIPGNASLQLQASVSLDEDSPLPLSLTVKKKVLFFWVTIPCESGSGSCNYNDICAMLPIPNPCPTAFKTYSIPCKCPIKSGNYNLPLSPAFTFTSGSLPSWLESGDYQIEAIVNNKSGEEIVCLNLGFSLEAN